MNENINLQIENSLIYYKRCKRRQSFFKPFFIISYVVLILSILLSIASYLRYIYSLIRIESINNSNDFWVRLPKDDLEELTEFCEFYPTIALYLSYIFYFALIGTIIFGIYYKLNKKAYIRHENKILTLKKEINNSN